MASQARQPATAPRPICPSAFGPIALPALAAAMHAARGGADRRTSAAATQTTSRIRRDGAR